MMPRGECAETVIAGHKNVHGQSSILGVERCPGGTKFRKHLSFAPMRCPIARAIRNVANQICLGLERARSVDYAIWIAPVQDHIISVVILAFMRSGSSLAGPIC